jgi:hypothetical protein
METSLFSSPYLACSFNSKSEADQQKLIASPSTTCGAVSQYKKASQSLKSQAFLEIDGNWLHIKYPKILG